MKKAEEWWPPGDIEYVIDTLLSLWAERDTITKEEILGHLEELLGDLDLI
jgi:hypothetical protein